MTARGDHSPGEVMQNAFDNSVTDKWLDFSNTTWIQYQFPNNQAYVITQYTITSAFDTATYPGRAPKSWVLEGSNDGVQWTPLDTETNQADTANLDTRTYSFVNTTAYSYYKLANIVNNGDADTQLAEIHFYGSRAAGLSSMALVASAPSASPAGGATMAGPQWLSMAGGGGTGSAAVVSPRAEGLPAPKTLPDRPEPLDVGLSSGSGESAGLVVAERGAVAPVPGISEDLRRFLSRSGLESAMPVTATLEEEAAFS